MLHGARSLLARIVFMQRQRARTATRKVQQRRAVARVLGGDQVDRFQDHERPQGDVVEIADGSTDDVEHDGLFPGNRGGASFQL